MGRGKVFVVEEADLMNPAAQNSMLKTLEEPAGRSLIILLADQPDALLPTIRSRCQVIRFAELDENTVRTQLRARKVDEAAAAAAARVAKGSLGLALRWVEDAVVPAAVELEGHVEAILGGRFDFDLPAWFKANAEAYAEQQLKRDPLASKDQATKEGLGVYLRVVAQILAGRLALIDDAGALERVCDGIDAVARAEQYLDANVNVALIFQQLAVTLERSFASAAAGR